MTNLWRRLTASRAEQEAQELQREVEQHRSTPISECERGCEVVVSGTVSSVSMRPKTEVPALEIEVYDGTGRLRVVWLGRRRIPGVDPGRRITVTGRLTSLSDLPTIYNPRYELKPSAS